MTTFDDDDMDVIPLEQARKMAARGETRQRLQPIQWADLHLLPKRKPLVYDLLDQGAFSVLYGGSHSGKTFFAIDVSAHVSLGWNWRGKQVEAGTVVYLSIEGGVGIEKRFTAFRSHHGVDVSNAPLYVIPEPIDLCTTHADTDLLIERLKALPGPPLALIVVDTVSRALAGGNENSSEDMGALVMNLDRIRSATGAHAMAVHHTGKDVGRGARGHSLLRAAADTEIEITKRDASAVATVTKQRDGPGGDRFGFALESVEIGRDEDDRIITSCVVLEDEPPEKERPSRPTGQAALALDQLQNALVDAGEIPPASRHIPRDVTAVSQTVWREYVRKGSVTSSDKPEAFRQAFSRSVSTLQKRGFIGVWDGWVWLVNSSRDTVTSRDGAVT